MILLENSLVLFNDTRCMYIVYDDVSKVELTDVLTAKNDVVAVQAFMSMLEKQKEKFNDYSIIRLVRIGTYDTDTHEICNNHKIEICSSNEDVEDLYKKLCERCKALNTEE